MECRVARKRIGVIGAGIIGASCAYRLQTESPNTSVTIVAADFSPNLTSYGSPGLHEIYNCYGTDPEKIRKWSLECSRHLKRLAMSCDSLCAGVALVKIVKISTEENSETSLFSGNMEDCRRLTSEELKSIDGTAKCGQSHITATCEPRFYLPWLYKRFVNAGGQMVKAKVNDLSKFCDEYDLVVNCSGLGAVQLVNDTSMIPIKGQIFRVKGVTAPCCIVDVSFYLKTIATARTAYIIPGIDMVALGGTFEVGEGSTHVDSEERQRILKACERWIPNIKDAKIVWEWAGLRPYRKDGIRLEIDESYHRTTKVIHNYGHAGIGVTVHWGCAGEVLNLARQCFESIAVSKSKL